MSSQPSQKNGIGRQSAAALVIASMVGAGIFTTPGAIAAHVGHPVGILLAWFLGGIVAFSGALVIAELGAAIPEQGGPYAYFHRIYGDHSAFLVGIVTVTVGYFAAGAAIALSTGAYVAGVFPTVDARLVATFLVLGLNVIHSMNVQASTRFNDIACLLKLALLAAFIVAGAVATGPEQLTAIGEANSTVTVGGLATAMALVFFAYSGWDTAAFVAGEMREPQKNLPCAILFGTGLIMALYLAMNLVFLKAVTPQQMADVHDVGRIAAETLFGDHIAPFFVWGIILLLISTCSAVTFVGPRIVVAMSHNSHAPVFLSKLNRRDVPSNTLIIQAVCMLGFVWFTDIDALFEYVGILLSVCAVFTIAAAIVFRKKEPTVARPFRMPLYPLPAIIFMAFSIYTIVGSVQAAPWPLLVSALTLVALTVLRAALRRST